MAHNSIHKAVRTHGDDKVYPIPLRGKAPAESEIRMLLRAETEWSEEDIRGVKELAAVLFPGIYGVKR